MKLRELAVAIGGELVGDGEVEITQVAEIDRAGPGSLVMVREARHLARAEASRASAVLLSSTVSSARLPAIRVSDARLGLARAIALLYPKPRPAPGIHPTAVVGPGTQIEDDVTIGPSVVIGERCRIGRNAVIMGGCVLGREVVVGEESILYPHVTLYDRTVLGARVFLHSGVVIGSDGFGYATDAGRHVKIPHIGRVVVEDDVEIGANTTIDRATLGETRIGAGTKIDNLVQIGHNVTIGPHCIIVAQVGIAGSVRIGSGVILAGKVGVSDHVTIGDGVTVLARSLVTKDIPAGITVSGSPARPHRDELKLEAARHRALDLLARVDALEQALRDQKEGPPAPSPSARPRRTRRTGRPRS